MALVLQRVPLEHSFFSPMQDWQSFLTNQVLQHLRYLCHCYDDTDVVVTFVPSKPALSVAAAWSFQYPHKRLPIRWSLAFRTISAARSSIGLNRGKEGEEGARHICSKAIDFAVAQSLTDRLRPGDLPKYAAMMGVVTVKDWLDQLLGPINSTGSGEFTTWTQQHWLNFKHVANLSKQVKPRAKMTRQQLGEFWLQHAAIQGVCNQKGWDLVIPAYQSDNMPTGDQIFSLSPLSYGTIQIKNCAGKPKVASEIGPPLASWPKGKPLVDTLELFLDLRGSTTLPHRAYLATSKSKSRDTEPHTYCVEVGGFNQSTYPILAKLDSDTQSKVPTLFRLPQKGARNYQSDYADYVRNIADRQTTNHLRLAERMKQGTYPSIGALPPTTEDCKEWRDDDLKGVGETSGVESAKSTFVDSDEGEDGGDVVTQEDDDAEAQTSHVAKKRKTSAMAS
ncbi:uncharacterized protein UTRI_06634 [Ustilago trichophora]|uniref:Uncharacterized protein n=1 Tax=Ustilago trichophora TaxID=86804 RepID=A0A5C3ELI5_9BASI|nr:uncharacterized protein UTRI_06634 [Ustilago trichophora]